jgi:hypothetical protein
MVIPNLGTTVLNRVTVVHTEFWAKTAHFFSSEKYYVRSYVMHTKRQRPIKYTMYVKTLWLSFLWAAYMIKSETSFFFVLLKASKNLLCCEFAGNKTIQIVMQWTWLDYYTNCMTSSDTECWILGHGLFWNFTKMSFDLKWDDCMV